jgi:hypothetical protein
MNTITYISKWDVDIKMGATLVANIQITSIFVKATVLYNVKYPYCSQANSAFICIKFFLLFKNNQ